MTTLSLGAAKLTVQNLVSMQTFYADLVGLEIIEQGSDSVTLGQNKNPVLVLIQKNNFTAPGIRDAGLYHTAIVFSERAKLAQTIERVITNRGDLYQGSSDHIATEAFYFADPEGNGLELYFDKPRSDWQFDQTGKPLMGSTYIDERAYINTYKVGNSQSNFTKMGHMHLKVGSIMQAKRFYVDILNFDIVNESTQTLFVSRDNYHHHIGMNTWQSLGATVRNQNTYGLKSFTIQFHQSDEFTKVINNLKSNNISFVQLNPTKIETQDPWGNLIEIELR